MIHPIPFVEFPGGGLPLHFAHANGYPPQAYCAFLTLLAGDYHVMAMEGRALWPASAPQSIQSWEPLAQDIIRFLEANSTGKVIGTGHSVGGLTTLMAALKRPDLFRALVIIEPPFFSPARSLGWHAVYRIGLANRLHPLTPSALRRRREFDSVEDMYENYRSKRVFKKISDKNLHEYVNSLAVPVDNGKVTLRYPPEWEARIYEVSMLSDFRTWRLLPGLRVPALFLRAEYSNAFFPNVVKRIKNKLPSARVKTIPGYTHLAPLEAPGLVAETMLKFLDEVL